MCCTCSLFPFYLQKGLKLTTFFSPLDLQKTKRAPKAAKVEVGTGTRDASMDEWLQVCGSYIFTHKETIIIIYHYSKL